jgi:hypothetical protein
MAENGERSRRRAAQAEVVKKMGAKRCTKPGVRGFFCPHFFDTTCAVGEWPMDSKRSWTGKAVPGQSLGGLESMGMLAACPGQGQEDKKAGRTTDSSIPWRIAYARLQSTLAAAKWVSPGEEFFRRPEPAKNSPAGAAGVH